MFLTIVGYAQQNKSYQIKIKTLSNKIIKGTFHQINNDVFVVISNQTDTSSVGFAEIKRLKVYEKGILGPSLLAGAGTIGLLSLAAGSFAGTFLIVGIPIGLTVGYVVSNAVSTKKRYRDFQTLDKALVKRELSLYSSN